MKHLHAPYFAILAFVFGFMLWALSYLIYAPSPVRGEIPDSAFSAARAARTLQSYIGDNIPHPTGSIENAKIRQKIVQDFSALGYNPTVQETLDCIPAYSSCNEVKNIVVHHKGTNKGSGGGNAILLTSHYDSVPAGPGAGDAISGVASILEIARLIKTAPDFSNDIIFLITDGEETGLHGANAFAEEHALFNSVKLVINLEARGSSGPSAMFETGPNNRNLIKRFAQYARKPVANSLTYEVYQLLPNDTDYSVYKRKGVTGLNYAFTGSASRYHSQTDRVDLLSMRTLQHHGDNGYAAVMAFGNADLSTLGGRMAATQSATYFDFFSLFLVHYPENLNKLLAGLSIVLLGFGLLRAKPTWGEALSALGLIITVIVFTAALGWLLSFPLGKWPGVHPLDHPYPWAGRAALIACAMLAPLLMVRLFRKYSKAENLHLFIGMFFALCGLACARVLPGASYMFIIPALAYAIGALFDTFKPLSLAKHIGLFAASYMAIYHFYLLDVIANFQLSHVKTLPLVLLSLALVPIFLAKAEVFKDALKGLMAVIAVTSIVGFFLPTHTPDHPRKQNFVLQQSVQNQSAVWMSESTERADKDMLMQAGFPQERQEIKLFGLYGRHRHIKPAVYNVVAPAEMQRVSDISDDTTRRFTMDIKTANNGQVLKLYFPHSNRPSKIYVEGKLAAEYSGSKGRSRFSLIAPKDRPYRVTLETAVGQAVEFTLVEAKSLSTEELQGLAQFRPANQAPASSGDRIEVFQAYSFPS